MNEEKTLCVACGSELVGERCSCGRRITKKGKVKYSLDPFKNNKEALRIILLLASKRKNGYSTEEHIPETDKEIRKMQVNDFCERYGYLTADGIIDKMAEKGIRANRSRTRTLLKELEAEGIVQSLTINRKGHRQQKTLYKINEEAFVLTQVLIDEPEVREALNEKLQYLKEAINSNSK